MTLSGLALTLDVFFQEQVVAVVDGIDELVDPVAQNQQACVAFQFRVRHFKVLLAPILLCQEELAKFVQLLLHPLLWY